MSQDNSVTISSRFWDAVINCYALIKLVSEREEEFELRSSVSEKKHVIWIMNEIENPPSKVFIIFFGVFMGVILGGSGGYLAYLVGAEQEWGITISAILGVLCFLTFFIIGYYIIKLIPVFMQRKARKEEAKHPILIPIRREIDNLVINKWPLLKREFKIVVADAPVGFLTNEVKMIGDESIRALDAYEGIEAADNYLLSRTSRNMRKAENWEAFNVVGKVFGVMLFGGLLATTVIITAAEGS